MDSQDEDEWSFEELTDTEEEITIVVLKPTMLKINMKELTNGGRYTGLMKYMEEQ